MSHGNSAQVTIGQVTMVPFIRCTEEAVMSDEDFASHRQKLREMLAEKTKRCPATARTENGKGTWRCDLEEGHEGEHMGLYTGNGAYLMRVAERISEKLCVRDGVVAWKSSENNQIQGWDESIAILQELIGEVIRQEREMKEWRQQIAERKYGVQKRKPRKSGEVQ
jgi:hypothetical protein